MASALANLSKQNPLLQYKCFSCDGLPKEEQINRCLITSDHILCILCTIKSGLHCPCGGAIESIVNPLIKIVAPQLCPFKSSGCDWVFSQTTNTTAHTSECKYRPYKCIGATMNLWKCNWNGLQKDFADHLQHKHLSPRQVFRYWHFGSVPCDPAKNTVIVHLIDAFNKKFLFFYISFATSLFVHFVVQLLGRKCDADKYSVELEVGADLKKMRFVEPCYSDADDLLVLLNKKQTMTIQKDYFQQYANIGGSVQFQFNLKRKVAVIEEDRKKEEYFKATMLADETNRTVASEPRVFPNPRPAPPTHPQVIITTTSNAKKNGKVYRNKKK